MSTVEDLILRIRAVGGKAAAEEIHATGGAIQSTGAAAKHMAGLAGLGAMAFGLDDVVKSAIKFQATQAQLQNSLKNTGQYSRENMKLVTEAADNLAKKGGWVPADAINSMQRLISVTHDVKQAIQGEALAQNLATKYGLSQQQATRLVMNAEQGRTTGLGRMGIQIKAATTHMAALTASHVKITPALKAHAQELDRIQTRQQILNKLWGLSRGSLDAYGHTAAGAMQAARNTIEIAAVSIGSKLLPVIAKVAQGIARFVDVLSHSRPALIAFGASVAGIFVFLNPWVSLIAAIGAGIYYLATHWKDVHRAAKPVIDWVIGAWHDIQRVAQQVWKSIGPTVMQFWNTLKTTAMTVFGVLKKEFQVFVGIWKAAWPVMLAIGKVLWPILRVAAVIWFTLMKTEIKVVLAVWKTVFTVIAAVVKATMAVVGAVVRTGIAVIIGIWNGLKGAVVAVVGFIKDHWKLILSILTGPVGAAVIWITTHLGSIVTFVGSLPGKIASVASNMWNALKTGLTDVINWVIGQWNALPMIHGFNIGPVHVPGVPQANLIGGNPGGLFSGKPNPGLFGPKHAATGGFVSSSGVFDVGERGRERIFLPAGSLVAPNSAIAASGGGGHVLENHVSFNLNDREFLRAVTYSMSKAKATR